MLYTADNATTGHALAASLLTSPAVDFTQLLANLSAQVNEDPSTVRNYVMCDAC